MANNHTQIGARVDEQLWQEFRDDVKQRYGRVNGHLSSEVEAALREYMEASHGGDVNDRLARIESHLENLTTGMNETQAKKQDSGVGKRVEDRLEDIIETVENEADGAPRVHDSVIQMAIEQHAGMSDPTIRQYKELLRERKVALQDPRDGSNYYYLDAPLYCNAVNDMLRDNEIDKDDYLEIVEERHGRDWWGDRVQEFEERHESDQPKGFQ